MTDSTGFNPNVTGPLSDMRVVDLTRLAAGNMLSHMMADFGAEVIKIERPEIGDDLRRFGHGGVWWKVYGRSKKSVTLNLKSEEGKELLKRIIADSDVMIENFVPGTLENWGLGPDVLWRNSPDLVIVRISGWGQTGPYSNRPGFGTLIEALSGFASMTGFDDKPPLLPPLALADMVAGLAGFGAVSTALLAREKGKSKGQVIDLSLFEPLHGILGPWSAEYIATGQTPRRMGNSSEVAAPRGVYLCKDGKHIAMSASMQSMWEQLAHAMGLPELVDDPRFKSTRDRVENQTELDEIVSEFFMRRNLKDNLDYCRQKGITAGEIADAADLIDHDYIKGREILVHAADKDFGAIPMHNVFPRLSATPGAIRAPAPDVGQHTAEILESMGINALQRKELARRGVI
ncbi:MAG: CoA transferase [Roseovarius sp.]|nr:CoA transferase [Roseovarius sp.]